MLIHIDWLGYWIAWQFILHWVRYNIILTKFGNCFSNGRQVCRIRSHIFYCKNIINIIDNWCMSNFCLLKLLWFFHLLILVFISFLIKTSFIRWYWLLKHICIYFVELLSKFRTIHGINQIIIIDIAAKLHRHFLWYTQLSDLLWLSFRFLLLHIQLLLNFLAHINHFIAICWNHSWHLLLLIKLQNCIIKGQTCA